MYTKSEIIDTSSSQRGKFMKETYRMEDIKLPIWAISYIEYNDSSNLTEDDIALVDNWLDEISEHGSPTFSYSDDSSFYSSPEFGLPTECVPTTIIFF